MVGVVNKSCFSIALVAGEFEEGVKRKGAGAEREGQGQGAEHVVKRLVKRAGGAACGCGGAAADWAALVAREDGVGIAECGGAAPKAFAAFADDGLGDGHGGVLLAW